MPERFAIYFAPAPTNPLSRRASEWLGRDSSSEVQLDASGSTGIDALHLRGVTRSARRYGFHATLKAPMTLAEGTTRQKLEEAMLFLAMHQPQVRVGPVKLTLLDGFLAIVPADQTAALTTFAQTVVEAFEPFRAPLSDEARRARIERNGLTPRQIDLLDAYGYPYTAEEFRFHMTLTDRLVATDRDAIIAAAERWFAPVVPETLTIDRLSLFHEPRKDAPFLRVTDFPLSSRVKV
jgi:putative phosphonate metabolism protein